MEKNKSTEIYKYLAILALVVLMAVMAVLYLLMPMVEERNELKSERQQLQLRERTLRNDTINAPGYKDDINKSRQQLTEALARYSGGNSPEKSIMLINTMENEKVVGIDVSNISFSTPTNLITVRMPKIEDVSENVYTVQYYDVNMNTETLTMSYSCSYEQLKMLIDFVNSYHERMNINSITVSYDSENNKLNGNLVLNLFAVTGGDKTYVAPEIENIRLGEDNIFLK